MAASIHNLPMELKCEIFSYLKKSDFLRLKRVDKTFKHDVEIDPKYQAELDAARRIELGLMRFKDRPLWQQVGLVSLCALFSPIILTYYSPDIIRWTSRLFTPRLKLVIQAVKNAATELFARVKTNLYAAAKWTYQNVLTPIGHAIQWVVRKAFDGLKWSYTHILTPLGRGIAHVARWSYNWILTPIGRVVKKIFTHIIIPACRFTINNVVVPVCRFTINSVVIPSARFIWKVVKGAFTLLQKVLTPIGKGLLRGARWTYQNIGIPVARVVWALAKGILITLPKKIYQHILTPIGHGIQRVSQFVYTYVLTPLGKALEFLYRNALVPIGNCIHLAGRIFYEKVLTPLAQLTYTLAHVIFVQVPVETWNLVSLQAELIKRRFA